jgi:hypothetical protein
LWSVADTNCDGNGNRGCKRYAYRDSHCHCDSNGYCYSNINTDAHAYADGSKGYADA